MKGVFVCQTRLKLSWEVNECKPLLEMRGKERDRGTEGRS